MGQHCPNAAENWYLKGCHDKGLISQVLYIKTVEYRLPGSHYHWAQYIQGNNTISNLWSCTLPEKSEM
jgi:hypothetical protein